MTNILANAAAEVTYPFPAFVFGLIGFGVFILLGVITWSFRDVANRQNPNSAQDHKNHH